MNIINRTAYSTERLEAIGALVGSRRLSTIEVGYFKATPKYHSVMENWLDVVGAIPCSQALVRLHWPGDLSRQARRWNSAPWHLDVVEPEHLSGGCSPMENIALMGGVAPMTFTQQIVARLLAISHNDFNLKKYWREEPMSSYFQEAIGRLTPDHRITFHTSSAVINLQLSVDEQTRKLTVEQNDLTYQLSALQRRRAELEQAKKTVERLTLSIPEDERTLSQRQAALVTATAELEQNRKDLEILSARR